MSLTCRVWGLGLAFFWDYLFVKENVACVIFCRTLFEVWLDGGPVPILAQGPPVLDLFSFRTGSFSCCAMWPSPSVTDLDGVLRFYGVAGTLWTAFTSFAPGDRGAKPAVGDYGGWPAIDPDRGHSRGAGVPACHRLVHLQSGACLDTWKDPNRALGTLHQLLHLRHLQGL